MANKEINDFVSKATPLATDEILLQATGGGTTQKTTLGDAVLDILSANAAALTFGSNGTVDFTGPAAANNTVEIQAATGRTALIRMQGADITHGMTGVLPTDVWGTFQPQSSSVGGADITAVREGDGTALNIRAFIGSTNPTDTTPAIALIGGKSDGGTGVADLAAAETVLSVSNNATKLYSIFGSGAQAITVAENDAADKYAFTITNNNAGAGLPGGIDFSSFSVDEPVLNAVADAITTAGAVNGQIAVKLAGGSIVYLTTHAHGT